MRQGVGDRRGALRTLNNLGRVEEVLGDSQAALKLYSESLNLVNSLGDEGSREIVLKLQANLAVLSACDTGRGKITGDGVIGLSRSLLSAGVSSVIVSLWAVPDKPTPNLMVTFYRSLQRTPDKAQTLRQAMLTQMQQIPSPRDWAAFILL